MSIELLVYSKEPVLDRERLASECLWPELPENLQWEIRFLSDSKELLPSGPISNGTVVGWHPRSPVDSQIRNVLTSPEPRELDTLSAENLLGSVYLSVVTPREKEDWEDIIESVKEEVDDPIHRKYLQKVHTFYSVETSATRNDLSLEFQEHLWRMIGVLTYGLMYDPQEGEFDLFEE